MDSNFRNLLKDAEIEYFHQQAKLNNLGEQGDDLELRLKEELASFIPQDSDIMDELAVTLQELDLVEQIEVRDIFRSSPLVDAMQEAPICHSMLNPDSEGGIGAKLLDYVYRNQFEGETPFGRLLHRSKTEQRLARAIRNAKDLLKEEIFQTGGGEILSLAGGPVTEIRECLMEKQGEEYRFLALDEDASILPFVSGYPFNGQLRFGYTRSARIREGDMRVFEPRNWARHNWNPAEDFKGLRGCFSGLKYKTMVLTPKNYDLVYSIGLCNFIAPSTSDDDGAQALVRNLFTLVKPGGSVVLGNINHSCPAGERFQLDFLADWPIYYREVKEILDLAAEIPEKEIADLNVFTEESGIYSFLKIKKAQS